MATQAAIKQAKQEAADAKMREEADKAYRRSLTSTEETDDLNTNLGKKLADLAREASNRAANKNMPQVDVMGNQTGFKKGGSVSSASKRADGIAQRGKTRGTIVMCGGGRMKK